MRSRSKTNGHHGCESLDYAAFACCSAVFYLNSVPYLRATCRICSCESVLGGARLDLLGPHRKVVRSAGRPCHDEYVATVSEMYEVLTPGSIQYIATPRRVRSTRDPGCQNRAYA
jgi:hypothetical protein